MNSESPVPLTAKKCVPCEGGISKLSSDEVAAALESVPGWQLTPDGQRIFKEWLTKDFTAAMQFFQRVAELAESEDHHPDLHLEGYRHARIEISTHAVGGLTENDFILAAKIDELPVALRKAS